VNVNLKDYYLRGKEPMNKDQQKIWDALKYDIRTNEVGTKRYFLNGELHREGGRAAEYVDGDKHWYLKGKLQRI